MSTSSEFYLNNMRKTETLFKIDTSFQVSPEDSLLELLPRILTILQASSHNIYKKTPESWIAPLQRVDTLLSRAQDDFTWNCQNRNFSKQQLTQIVQKRLTRYLQAAEFHNRQNPETSITEPQIEEKTNYSDSDSD